MYMPVQSTGDGVSTLALKPMDSECQLKSKRRLSVAPQNTDFSPQFYFLNCAKPENVTN